MDDDSDLSLLKFNKQSPPGWRPGIRSYPLRLWLKRLQLWYRVTDLPQASRGPAVAARLEGRPFDLAVELTLNDHNGARLYGDEALAYPGDANLGVPDGLTVLIEKLRQVYGAAEQTVQVSAVDMFEDCKRQPGQTLQQFLTEWEHLYNQASRLAGYALNDTTKTHRLLKHCGLPKATVDHILLDEDHDYARFQPIWNRIARLARTEIESQLPGAKGYKPSGYYSGQSDPGNYQTDPDFGYGYGETQESPYDQDWSWSHDDSWQEEGDSWYYTEEPEYGQPTYGTENPSAETNEWPTEETWTDSWASDSWTSDSWASDPWSSGEAYKGYRKGKGKSKGKGKNGKGKSNSKGKGKSAPVGRSSTQGCGFCGSPNHDSDFCPWRRKGSAPKGKGKGKGKGKSKQKGKFPSDAHFAEQAYVTYAEGGSSGSGTQTQTQTFAIFTPRDRSEANTQNQTTNSTFNAQELPTFPKMKALFHTKESHASHAYPVCSMPTAHSANKTDNFAGIPSFHAVKGENILGLIFDPGAPDGLTGTETLRRYQESVLHPSGLDFEVVQWKDESYAGIEGEGTPSKLRAAVPIDFGGGLCFSFHCDTIGRNGDLCPMLFPNRSCIEQRAIALFGYFDGGDGLLILPTGGPNSKPAGIRMLLTDSRHYLLPLKNTIGKDTEEPRSLVSNFQVKNHSRHYMAF